MMKVDIVFISFNRSSEVKFNLDKMSCYKNLNKIIWVDNGSKDGINDIQYDPRKVTALKLPANIGIQAYNIGVENSDADVVIILDDDSHIEEDAIEKTIQKFSEDALLGALAFKIVLPGNNENVTKDWPAGSATYFWGCGAAVKKSVWDKLGGYRKELFLYCNEYDYCIRVWNEGFKVVYVDDVVAWHRVSNMHRTSERLITYSLRNNYIYIKTYFSAKYHPRLFFYDRLAWFIRALLAGSAGAFFKGIKMAKQQRNNIQLYPIHPDIQKFYINHQRIFENPLKKISRKYKHGLLFRVSKSV
jgi:Predicted glycosyltransferases